MGSIDERSSLSSLVVESNHLGGWDLNENSTTGGGHDSTSFDGHTSDTTLHTMWSIYAPVFYVLAAFNLIIFLAMATNKAIWKNSFNLYLMFIILPDIIFSVLCASTCAFLAASNHQYERTGLCEFQSFYLVFGVGTSAWINGVVAHEIHHMLRVSRRGIRYTVPRRQSVVRNALICYAWMLFVASWGVFGFPWHGQAPRHGIFCFPDKGNDRSSSLFFWLVFMPCMLLIPVTYVVGVTFDILRRKLMPPSGRRRQLTIYFFRIMLVYIVFWLPTILIVSGVGGTYVSPWLVWVFGLWGHLQGGVSTMLMIASKADVRRAVNQFVRYKRKGGLNSSGRIVVPSVNSVSIVPSLDLAETQSHDKPTQTTQEQPPFTRYIQDDLEATETTTTTTKNIDSDYFNVAT